MRIIHTADWHLGKMFYGDYLTGDQRAVLVEQFLPLLAEYKPDAVILAGDVYDRSLPPVEAVELFDEVATKIVKDLCLPFFVIAGNHDSAQRLSFGSRLLETEKFYVAGDLRSLTGPVEMRDAFGPVDIVLLPFADPAKVRLHYNNPDVCDHESALIALRNAQCPGLLPGRRSIAVAHAFVAGGTGSDSERPLSVGGSDSVSARIFAPFTYAALGHLHGPQQIGCPEVRYSGSLMKYSFSEAAQKKGVVLVDMDGEGQVETKFLSFTPKRDVRVLTGFFDDLMAAPEDKADDYVLLRLEDKEPVLDGMNRARKKYPHVLAMEMPQRQAAVTDNERTARLHSHTDEELFSRFAAAMRPGASLTKAEGALAREVWTEMEKEEGER